MSDVVGLLCVGALFGALALAALVMLYGVRGLHWFVDDVRRWLDSK